MNGEFDMDRKSNAIEIGESILWRSMADATQFLRKLFLVFLENRSGPKAKSSQRDIRPSQVSDLGMTAELPGAMARGDLGEPRGAHPSEAIFRKVCTATSMINQFGNDLIVLDATLSNYALHMNRRTITSGNAIFDRCLRHSSRRG
jgi:hypothetical protein